MTHLKRVLQSGRVNFRYHTAEGVRDQLFYLWHHISVHVKVVVWVLSLDNFRKLGKS